MLLGEIHNISLQNHRAIHKAKSIKGNIILHKELNTGADSAKSLFAFSNDSIADLALEFGVIHLGVMNQFFLNPRCIGIRQDIQSGNNVIFFLGNGKCPHREIEWIKAIQSSTNPGKFIFRNKR